MSEQRETNSSGREPISRIALLGFGVAILSAVVMMGAALGYRLGLWSFGFALLTLTEYAAYAAFAGGAISLIGLGRSLPGSVPGMVLSVIGVVVGGYSCHMIYQQWVTVKSVPFIHDITTDTVNPPAFIAVVAAREAEGANPHDYAGEPVARQQECGYPDLTSLLAEAEPAMAYDRALEVAESMAWEIVAADRALGRIEATDTSTWYGFKDDIVIRVLAADGDAGSRVDVRSLSRVGRSDVGINAARIRSYLSALEKSL